MTGRAAFTSGADKAAAFIRREFEAIGLQRFAGLDDYVQPFRVYSLTARRARVVLNGRRVPDDLIVVRIAGPAVHWTTGDSVRVDRIGPADDPMAGVRAALGRNQNSLVLVSRRQQQLFTQLKRFMSGPSRTLNPGGARNVVFVQTDDPAARSFRVDIEATVDSVRAANVVGTLRGRRPDEVVLFSAHYDHIGIQPPVNGDSIANGANDDASGTTAVIELARYFKAKGTPERTLVFVTFTAEEAGGFGSQYFSRQIRPDQIVAMCNIEMIGKPSAQGPNTAWITGFDKSSLGTILQQAVAGTQYSFVPDPYPAENLFLRSDNATLARLGVPAHSISTTPIDVDRDYHQVSDEVGTLDLDNVTTTIRAVARAAGPIVAGTATPTRVVVTP